LKGFTTEDTVLHRAKPQRKSQGKTNRAYET
jgi:hypothetical protein